ncbi:unnamed protein product [Lampetra fluviatilis]
MASATPSESVDSELRCSICMDTFDCPSTLSCGHSFCLRCLESAWETASSFSCPHCPQCRATFPVRPQLRRNVALANLAEQLRVGDKMAAAIACDNCGDGQTPAVKTCLRCEMSFCATHLRPHLENPRLREHLLVAPIANLEERRCKEHRDELKYFCEQDEISVCTGCTITGDHSGHRVITVEKAQQIRQEELRVKKKGRDEKRNMAESRIRTLRDDYRRVEESVHGIKARISREFERRREQLREEEREALEHVDEEGCSVLSRIQADITRYESRARGLEQEINQLLTALTVQDPLYFLQDPVHENLRRSSVSQETQDDPAPVSSRLNLAKLISVGGVRTNLLAALYGCSPTLDTNSAYDYLQISSDLKTTRVGEETRAVEEKRKEAEESMKRMEAARKEAQESVAGIRDRVMGKFAHLRKALDEDEREALHRVAVKERELLSRIDEDIARHKQEIGELQAAAARLHALQHERDSLAFLQGHLEVMSRREIPKESAPPPPTSLDAITVHSLERAMHRLLPLVYGCSPTLDTKSAHDDLLQISSDLRTVTRSDVPQGRPHHPHRFECWPQALCSESFSSGRHYWEVDVGRAGWYRVGVAYGTIPRRGRGDECGLGGSDVSWCLQKRGARFSVRHGGVATSLSVPEPPQRVGVHLDWDAGLLSFYSADSMAPLHSFHQTFPQPLHPGLWVGFNGASVRIVDLSGAS